MRDIISDIKVGDLVKITGRSRLPIEELSPYIVLDVIVDTTHHPTLYEFKLFRNLGYGQSIFYWTNMNFHPYENITKKMKSDQ